MLGHIIRTCHSSLKQILYFLHIAPVGNDQANIIGGNYPRGPHKNSTALCTIELMLNIDEALEKPGREVTKDLHHVIRLTPLADALIAY